MSELPEGWVMVTVGEAGEVSLGRQRAPKYHHGDGMRPYLRVANVFEDRIDTSDIMEMHFSEEEFERYRLRPGDILLNEGQSPQFLGRPAIYRGYPRDIAFTNSLIRFRARPAVTPEWALIVFRHHMRSKRFMRESRITTNIAHLSAKRFSTVEFPIPPLLEQKRIVAAIGEQFSRIDAGDAALERVRQNLKRLRVHGVSSLFDPLWPRVPLADVLTLISDCPHRTPSYTDGEVYPALRPRDIVGGELRLQTSAKVSAQEYRLQTARHTPEAGDIVYSRELSYGWAVELPEKPPICLSQGMVLLRTIRLLPGFLTLFLNSHEGRQQADRAATGTAHPHINLRDIKQYQVPLASLTDQKRVLALASDLKSECDRTSQSVAAAMIRAAALRNTLLSCAFSGRLAQQNPNDEPASALLERITAERASSNGQKPTRTRKARTPQEGVTV